ncbi:hypothetical protein AC1031_002506 [Aphanomyces cochlioides]|nr:hypothetical protein AC1031_002506 [Aphanomyces cochlioides]
MAFWTQVLFDAIGFSWNGNEENALQQWEENLEALRIYKSIHGNLNVPQSYKVKAGDSQWLQKFWEKNLVTVLRTRQETMNPERREILDSMGFVWDAIQAKWEKNLLALETYKAIHEDLLVKQSFVVPEQDPAWPKDTWNMNLGYLVSTCRKTMGSLPPEIYDALTTMGFVWKVRDKGTGPGRPPIFSISKQHEILKIVEVQYKLQGHTKFSTLPNPFKVPSSSEWPQNLHGCNVSVSIKIYGHLEVPQVFEVPEDDPEWPVHLWTMRLGLKVATIRRRQTELALEQRQELDALDFVWDATKLYWNRNLSALKTYMQLYGNLRVPQTFVVPKDDPDWPSDYANIKLGTVVNYLRSIQATLSDEKKQELNKLGFVWSVKS